MLHHSQATSLDDIYLDDIPHIIHPGTATRDLADTAQPNRIIQEWSLPQGYTRFVSRYHQFHWQRPWMAYSDTLDDIRSGKVVLLKKNISGHAFTGVLTSSGNLRNDLPLFLHSRLSYLISKQLKRPGYYVRPATPVQHAQAAKTINSKAAGRLLAAGGIYNGNIEGFRQTAEQLGGDAPAGYDQVMDNKGLLITGTSIAAGLTMGRINPADEIKALEELNSLSPTPEKIGGFSVRELSNNAGVIDKSPLTKAGRALQKHGDRIGSIFPKATGDAVAKNAQGQCIVDSILNDPNKTVLLQSTGRFGQVIDVTSSKGQGLRYDANGNLIGFLEPPK